MGGIISKPIYDSVSEPMMISSIRTSNDAKQRIINFMGHAIKMLDHLQKQNANLIPHTENIYIEAQNEILLLNNRIQQNLDTINPEKEKNIRRLRAQLTEANLRVKKEKAHKRFLLLTLEKLKVNKEPNKKKIEDLEKRLIKLESRLAKSIANSNSLAIKLENSETNLSKKDVKKLSELLKQAEKEIVSILQHTQIEVISEIAEASATEMPKKAAIKDKVATLAAGGLAALWIRFLSLVSSTNRQAIAIFEKAKGTMERASRNVDAAHFESEMELDKWEEFAQFQSGRASLDRRAGVIGLGGIYRIQVAFSAKNIQKQFKSFIAQNMGDAERTTIERNIDLEGQTFTSRSIPLNRSFDAFLATKGIITAVFSSIFGTKGISSANRREPHLVNGYESNLIVQGKTLFRALRHAITSDKYEKDPAMRAQNSRRAAEELLKAALLQEIAAQGLTLEQARLTGVILNLNSVSLVTPDDIRPYLPGQADERKMLLDQVMALGGLKEAKFLEIDGVQIPVKLSVNTFNFGVNAGAKNWKLGLGNQYEHNLKALEGLREHVLNFKLEVRQQLVQLEEQMKSQSLPEKDLTKQKADSLNRAFLHAEELMADIELLMKDKKAYLQGENQYEIGAKILNLSNLMDQTMETINKAKPARRLSGFKSAFNCMSGKDRTGMMDAVAKAFAIMAETRNGHYPSHEEFKDATVQKEFAKILGTILLQGGSLDITEINTGAKGYKVGGEARLFGMSADQFLQAQGFSATTSS